MNEIFSRVSIRKYQDKPVEDDKIKILLKAAMAAPSAGNQQPWEFYVVRDKEILEALSKTSPYAGCTKAAPAAIVSVYRNEGLMFPEYAQIDMSIAMENLWLEAESQGLGGVWLGVAPIQDRMEAVTNVLSLPDTVTPFAIFPFGYPAEERPQQDRYEENRVHFV